MPNQEFSPNRVPDLPQSKITNLATDLTSLDSRVDSLEATNLTTSIIGSDNTTVLTWGSTFVKTIAVGIGYSVLQVWLKNQSDTVVDPSSANGALVLVTQAAAEANSIVIRGTNTLFYSGSAYLTGGNQSGQGPFNTGTPNHIGLSSAVYNTATGDLTLTFAYSNAGPNSGNQTLSAFWTIIPIR
jgi:hypothetical protein